MKIIIDIPDNNYQWIKERHGRALVITQNLYASVREGIPLDDFLKRRKEPIDESVVESYLKERTMPNSLKCRLKKLAYQGLLSEKDLSRIYTDNDVVAELEKIRAEIEELIQH